MVYILRTFHLGVDIVRDEIQTYFSHFLKRDDFDEKEGLFGAIKSINLQVKSIDDVYDAQCI